MFPDVFAAAEARVASCPFPMGGAAGLASVYSCARGIAAERVVETGVAYGWSSLALLLALHDRRRVLASTNFPYPEFSDEVVRRLRGARGSEGQLEIVPRRRPGGAGDAIAAARPLDLCHYDSDKSYAGRMASYRALWAALRVGGLFLSDDVGDNLAFAHFARMARQARRRRRRRQEGAKYVGAIRRTNDRPLADWMF